MCILQLVLNDGRLTLTIFIVNCQLNIGNHLNDGAWHDVRLFVRDGSVIMTITSYYTVHYISIVYRTESNGKFTKK